MPRRVPIELSQPPCTVVAADDDWPACFGDLGPDAPPEIAVAGRLPPLDLPWVAIVGTRHADDGALDFAQGAAFEIASAGGIVVSGGARGIDAAAHRGAMEAGGATVAVLGTGLQHAYPPEHAPLFSEIARRGAVLSEPCPDGVPFRGRFLRRNRLIAALGRCVLVVQAPVRSGALSTARCAAALQRPVYAVPDAPWRARSGGCLQLLADGARLCPAVSTLLQYEFSRPQIGPIGPQGAVQKRFDFDPLDGYPAAVVRCLKQSPATPDRIGRQLDIPIDRVQEVLLTLELEGVVRQHADGSYSTES